MSEAQKAGVSMLKLLREGYIPKTFWTQNAKMGHAKPEINFLYVADFKGDVHTLGEFKTQDEAIASCVIIRRSAVLWLFSGLEPQQKITMAIHSLIHEGV